MDPTPTSATASAKGNDPADDNATRRLRKREFDRRAQRAARERTKNRIAQLEAMVAALSHQSADAQLLQQLDSVTKQRDEMSVVISSIEATTQGFRSRMQTGEKDCAGTNQDQSSPPPDKVGMHPRAAWRDLWCADH
jgi:hypothetical protein